MDFSVDQTGAWTCHALAQISVMPDTCYAAGGQTIVGSAALAICGIALTVWAWRRFL